GAPIECPSSETRAKLDVADEPREKLLGGLRILVVDDEDDSRALVCRLLAARGADVSAAPGVAEALTTFAMQPFDVIVSDISMPHRDGNELIREIRRLPSEQGGRIPAVALTAFARPEDRTQSLRAGFQAHIAKPVDVEELVALVAAV